MIIIFKLCLIWYSYSGGNRDDWAGKFSRIIDNY